ncbi:F0F1 ATP synthase subunit A [Roseiterribacter gracilis]|uniref:ATP synthase subunit a n=1 Tax=Roseiterribacter gracilis TaxID=2812848 RepID=A0A8S8XA28_9PROT|nr:ATP synthase subunit a [Rhodospirillales bacterium TMPK1]
MSSPLEQFKIEKIVPLKIGAYDVSLTNSGLFMLVAVAVATLLLIVGMRRGSLVPSRLQSIPEILYEVVAGMVRDNVGPEGKRYLPWIFSLFLFVLFGNLIGLVPYTFTFTSHIIVTFAMAATIFLVVTLIGFIRHGTHYFRMFFPEGAPLATAPVLIPIELVSYLSRPISLGVRLFANMTVGHLMLAVVGGFVVPLGLFGILPVAFLTAITALEFMIAVIQAYVFAILTCIYLNDALNMH